jgi:hypothetical protein
MQDDVSPSPGGDRPFGGSASEIGQIDRERIMSGGEGGQRRFLRGARGSFGDPNDAAEGGGRRFGGGMDPNRDYAPPRRNHLRFDGGEDGPGEASAPRGAPDRPEIPENQRATAANQGGGSARFYDAPTGLYNPMPAADYMNAAKEAQRAISEQAGDDLQKAIGNKLGDLNAIGALRSGATSSALRDISEDYSKQVSRAGAANSLTYLQMRDEAQNAAARTAALGAVSAADREERALEREESRRRFDATFGLERDRFGEDTRRWGSEFGEGRRRFDSSFGLERDRFGEDTRRFNVGHEFDRERFGEDTRRYNTDDSFRRDRAGRSDFEGDREFGYRGDRDRRDDFLTDREYAEDQRRYNQQRNDYLKEQARKRKASRWGVFGRLAGAGVGAIFGGPAGAQIGAGIGGAAFGG